MALDLITIVEEGDYVDYSRQMYNENFLALQDAIGKGDRATFILAEEIAGFTPRDLEIGTDVCNHYIVTKPGTLRKCVAVAKIGPAGSSIQLDIKLNGYSIFTAGTYLEISDGATTATPITTFAETTVVEGDILTIDVVQVGSSTAGRSITVVLDWWYM